MSERLLWVNVCGHDKADWRYIVVTYRDGEVDYSVAPRWATESDCTKSAPEAPYPSDSMTVMVPEKGVSARNGKFGGFCDNGCFWP